MPIKPENRDLYPKNWSEIRERILARAKYRCEFCKIPNYSVGCRDSETGEFYPVEVDHAEYGTAREQARTLNGKLDDQEIRYIVIVLTIAHLDHDPRNNNPENLRALCQRCHNLHDGKRRARTRRETLREKKYHNANTLF